MKFLSCGFLLTVGWMSGSAALAQTPGAPVPPSPWKTVEKILGRPGIQQGDMLKVAFPRTDLNVTVHGIPIEPQLALTSWFAFKPLGKVAQVTGKLVLLDREVPKVMVPLKKRAFQVSEIRSQLLNESPGMKCLYIEGRGSRGTLAQSVVFILSFTGTPLLQGDGGQGPPHISATPNPGSGLDFSEIEAVLGPGKLTGKVLQYDLSRAEKMTGAGSEIPSFMGLSSTLNFQKVRGIAIGRKGPWGLAISSKTSKEVVAAAGSLLVSSQEADRVAKILRKRHIQITSQEPVFFDKEGGTHFLNFWTEGPPEEVAAGLKAALGKSQPTEMK